METYTVWKSRPVFITSTFKDMHAERDHLRQKVFPELEERLKERFHHLEPIDLRWGVETVSVDEQQAKELLVLKVCLAEIERSRPFLIALIGDRYGWIPPEERIRVAAEEAGYEGDVVGKSVTALEIEYGVLVSADQRRRSRFYFREPLPYDEMDPETAALYSDEYPGGPGAKEAHDRLDALKSRVEKNMPDRTRRYKATWDPVGKCVTGLEEWGQQVLEDLWKDLEHETREYMLKPVTSWQEQERRVLGQFIETQCREFLGRVETIAHLMELATSPATEGANWGASVVGAAGSGKSSLFAEMFRELHELEEKGDILLLAHAAGISGRSGRVDSLLRRWIGELAGFLGVPDNSEEMTSREDLENEFTSLLSRASVKVRVVCLIDALNQFERTTTAKYLTWLPKIWPDNARLITTAIPGTESGALGERPGVEEVDLPLLDELEAEHIINAVCARYHKQVHTDIVRVLVSKELSDGKSAAGIPLWLELAVEELLLLDADDFERAEREYEGTGEQKLHKLLMDVAKKLPPEIEELYAYMLQRTEDIHGEKWARGFANLIALSRNGWRETDIRAMLPGITGKKWDELEFAGLRRSFRAHILQRGAEGQWDFTHAQMREAISPRSLEDEKEVKGLHTRIADHLESLATDDPSRQSELMFHIIGADNRKRAAEYYGGDLAEGELQGATQALAEHILAEEDEEPNPGLEWAVSLLNLEDIADNQVSNLCHRYMFELRDTVESDARLPTKHEILSAVNAKMLSLAASDPSNARWQRKLAVSHDSIGDMHYAKGDLAGALEAFRAALDTAKRLTASDPGNVTWQRDLSLSHERIGHVLNAQGDLAGALKAYKASFVIRDRLAASDPGNALLRGDLASNHGNIGDVLYAQGNLAGALKAYKARQVIIEGLAASDPSNTGWQRDLLVSHSKIGDMLRAKGDFTSALGAYKAALDIAERLVTSDPNNTGWQRNRAASQHFVGFVLEAQGDLDGALEAYEANQASMKRLVASDPSNTSWQRDLSISYGDIGVVLSARGDLAGALKAYQESYNIVERLAATDPSNTIWQSDLSICQEKIGDVLLAQGNSTGALEAYEVSLGIRDRLAASDPSNAAMQHGLAISHGKIGGALYAKGDSVAALEAYELFQAGMKSLVASDPSNADWQRDLSVSLEKIGDTLRARGDLSGALNAYKARQDITERLVAFDPSNTVLQHDLSISHERIGNMLHAQGDLTAALKAYKAAFDIADRLVESDPSNASWQHNLSNSHVKIGNVLQAQGDPAGALKAYMAANEILTGLAASDPSNAGWQHHLSVSHFKIGDMLGGQDDLAGALKAYKAYQAGMKRLAVSDPGNVRLEKHLSVSHERIGNMLRAKGDLTGAAKAYKAALDIAERLVASDPSNTEWQYNLSLFHNRIGDVRRTQGDLKGALKAYEAYQAIMKRLTASEPSKVTWQRDLVASNGKIAEMLHAQGDLTGALNAYKATNEILARLAKSDPGNTILRRSLAASHSKIGVVLLSQGDRTGALKAFKANEASIKTLAASDPGNADWQRDLAASYYLIAAVHQQAGKKRPEMQYWRRCHKVLRDMKAKGMPLDEKMAGLLRQLETGK